MAAATVIANNFIKKSLGEDIPITPMKLQKLIYFLYKDYLKQTGYKLFTESFEVWKYGPVLPSVYEEFKCFGAKPIERFARDSMGNVSVAIEDGLFREIIISVWNKYKYTSAWELSVLTHKTGTAWEKAKNNKRNILCDEDIKDEL